MATSEYLEQIERDLRNLRSPDALQRFFAERDYSPDDVPLRLPDSPELTSKIAAPPRILNQAYDFHIIHIALQALSRADERALIAHLLPRHPYALFVFSDAQYSAWHFVNVKLIQGEATDSKLRRLFRRISISQDDRLRTACERLAQIDLRYLTETPSALAIQKLHDDAFDVEAVTKQFFRDYRGIFEAAERHIGGIHGDPRRIFTQRLFNRLMFILFLERKGLLKFPEQRDRDYLRALWQAHRRQARADFYTERLKPLFFTGLNTPNAVNIPAISRHGALQQIIGDVPYLNGGLFERAAEDENDAVRVPDQALAPAIDDLFYRYNFTVTESTPFDLEVAVDPEMLGKIFEELVVGRHETGSYYTPKSIVSFMCRAALKSYLQVRCEMHDEQAEQALDAFIEEDDAQRLPDPEAVLDALRTVRICDPACGSGAYLLGMMQELLRLRHALFTAKHLDSKSVYDRKLEIIQQNLYGVDSDPFAVNIAQLRLWLSLIVDYESDAPPPPLPNLDYKIEVGNSLTAPAPMPIQQDLVRYQQIERFLELKAAYLKAHGDGKKALRQQIEQQRAEIREWMLADRRLKDVQGFDWQVEFAECFAAERDSARGFDIVIANPPYIRQELIKSQKSALQRIYGSAYSATADLYVYFYLRALELLKPDGTLCFISSNKWLRAAYGKTLRQKLAQEAQLLQLIDFGDLPVFGAIAYPMILTARKAPPRPDHAFRALPVQSLRTLERLPAAVRHEGFWQPQSSLSADGWTLTRPEALRLLEKLRANGTPLGDYVGGAIYRGVLTGYNEAFVIDRATRDRLIAEDPKSAEIIKPFLRGRDIKRWRVNFAEQYLIFTRRGIDIDQYPAIKRHLLQYKDRLMPGAAGGRKAGSYKWYEIQDNIAYYAEFEKPKIVYPNMCQKPEFVFDDGRYYTNQKCFIIPINDMFLLGVLNSKVTYFLFRHTLPMLRGATYEPSYVYMKDLPIANAPQALRDQIGALAQRLSALRGQGAESVALEDELNALVYQAYGLEPSEIALIEASPQPISLLAQRYPDRWLVVRTQEDDANFAVSAGHLLGVYQSDREAFEAARRFEGQSLYIFYSNFEREADESEQLE
jgi:hypothetical protein